MLNFCNAAVFHDYKNIGVIEELNHGRKCMNNIFHETILVDRILITLLITDVVILKIDDNIIENVLEKFHDLKENVLYMLSFKTVIREEEAN